MAETKLFLFSLCLSIVTGVVLIVAFSTPYWIEQKSTSTRMMNRYSAMVPNAGLWEMCFNRARFPRSQHDLELNGCWYVFSKHLDPHRSTLSPGWFIGVQAIAAVSIVAVCAAILCLLLYFFRMCSREYETLVAAFSLEFAAAIAITIAATMYGVNIGGELWLPTHQLTQLSWSFGIFVLCDFLAVFSGMAILVSSVQYRAKYVT